MSSPTVGLPKSILKQTNYVAPVNNTSSDDLNANTTNNINIPNNSNSAQSWFSKLNSNNDTSNPSSPIISPRINNLFGSFRKQSQQQQQQQQQQAISAEENILASQLVPRQIRRVRFPVANMTRELIFKKEDIITETKNERKYEPINIQTSAQLLSVYESSCRLKQEPTIDLFVSTLITQPNATFLTRLDLSNQSIDRYSISPLADVMSIGFGIQELILNNCNLDDSAIKILMHSLLENDKIKYLSLAKNSKLTVNAFKYTAIYINGRSSFLTELQSSQLSTLDLSNTQPDKKSLQYILAASVKKNKQDQSPSLYNLVLNGCNLRAPHLEILSTGVRKAHSTIKQLSIRRNKINGQSAVAVGVMLRDYDQPDEITYGLERLLLDDNDLSQGGIQYIAQALRRNQCLRYLSICECKIDSKDFILICEALKYNQFLERLDIGYNTLRLPNLDGFNSLKGALNINRSLKDLCLADTGLDTEATISLAECLSENSSIVRMDLSRNPKIQLAGLLAISASMKINNTITLIDISVDTGDKEMMEIHNALIAACTRNSQSKKTGDSAQKSTDHSLVTTAQKTARLTLQERLEAVTKGKNIRPSVSSTTSEQKIVEEKYTKDYSNDKDDNAILVQQAFDKVSYLEDILSGRIPEQDQIEADKISSFEQCKELHSKICLKIPEISESSQLDLLLAINDRLTVAIQSYEEKNKIVLSNPSDSEENQENQENHDPLSQSFEIGDDDDDDDELIDDIEEVRGKDLKELRSEIEAEESAAFLKAKKAETDENQVVDNE